MRHRRVFIGVEAEVLRHREIMAKLNFITKLLVEDEETEKYEDSSAPDYESLTESLKQGPVLPFFGDLRENVEGVV